jgi:flagellar biosynthesis/type III secretory pathway M-ring protein FliF/YscJ
MELDDGYVTVPKGTSLQNIGYELTYVEQTEDGIIANIEYKIGDNSLGKTSLRLNVNKEESSEASPYREEEEQDIQKQKEFPINIYVVGGILASILVLFLVIKILRKTSGKRKVKRARKKLFKNNRLH